MSGPTLTQDIGGTASVYVPVYVDTSGLYGRIPNTGYLDIAGIYSSNFTVGGKAIMLADGTASDGTNSIDLQTVYLKTTAVDGAAKISLEPGKDFSICDSLGNSYITVDAETGKITINGEMSVISSIVKFTGAYQEFSHLNILPNDGSRTALLIEPKGTTAFTTDAVRIRTTSSGPVDFSINSQGQTYIRDLIVDSIDANLIDGIDFNSLSGHLSPSASPFKHFASEILYVPQFQNKTLVSINVPTDLSVAIDTIIDQFSNKADSLTSAIDAILADEQSEVSFFQRIATLETNVTQLSQDQSTLVARVTTVESDIVDIRSRLTQVTTANIVGINFEQIAPSSVWTITHNTGSQFIQFSVYDDNNRLVWPDDAFALDLNTFVVSFSAEQTGRAILSCLIPPVTTILGEAPITSTPEVQISFNDNILDVFKHNIQTFGAVSLDGFSRFGSTAMLVDLGGYISVDLANDAVVAGENFSVSMWFLPGQFTADTWILSLGSCNIGISSGRLAVSLYPSEPVIKELSSTIVIDEYQHLAVIKQGLMLKIYLNGVLRIATNISELAMDSFVQGFSTINIGGDGQEKFVGLIDDFLFVKDILFQGEFTPIDAPLANDAVL